MDEAQRWQILRLHVEDGIPLASPAKETGIGERTLQRWHVRYHAHGYDGLATGTRADDGTRRFPVELVALIEGLALSRPRPAIATIHRAVAARCASRRWPAPSCATLVARQMRLTWAS